MTWRNFLARYLSAIRPAPSVRRQEETPRAASPAPPPRTATPAEPMPISRHWQKVVAVVDAAIGSAGAVTVMQREAAVQLDAAAYALDRLIEELATAMPLPQLARTPAVARIGARPAPAAAPFVRTRRAA